MFFHTKQLQYNARPDRPDPVYAKKLQEVLGGQFGEITVMMQYLFQGWNCRGLAKYRDMLLDIGTEEIAHVEMLSTMIAQLLNGAPLAAQEEAAQNPLVGAIMGGTDLEAAMIRAAMNPQHVPMGPEIELGPADPRVYGTGKEPKPITMPHKTKKS
jgi:Mn-containing catalase